MRYVHIGFLILLLTTCAFARASNEIFALKGQLALTGKDESIVQPVSLDKGSKLLLIGKNQLQFWDVPSGKLIGASSHKIKGFWAGGLGLLRRLIDFPIGMEVSPDGRTGILATKVREGQPENERTAVVWDLRTGEQRAVLNRPMGPMRSVNFSEDGSTIMTINGELKEAELAFWNAADFTHRAAIKVQDLSFYQLSRDGEHVFIGSAEANKWLDVTVMGFESSKGIELWNTRTGKLEKTYSDGDIKFWNLLNAGPSVSPDEKYLAARSEGNKIVVWETAGDGMPKHYIADGDPKKKLRLVGTSDDSRYLLTLQGEEALIYELETGKLYRRFPLSRPNSYTLSPDSRYAIRRSQGSVSVYDLENEKYLFALQLKIVTESRENEPSSETEVENAKLSPDGKFIMIYGDKNVRIYKLDTGEEVQSLVDPQRVKYKDNGKIKDNGLKNNKAGWLASGNSVYVFGEDGRSVFLWNKK